MPDRPDHKPALAGNDIFEGSGIRLEPLPEGHLLHVMGDIDRAYLAKSLSAAGLATSAVRQAGYQQWYVTGDESLTPSQIAFFADQLKGQGFVCDQSHGRIRIALSGSRALELLSQGTAVDLDLAVFPVGHSAITLFGHISVQLTRMQVTGFEFVVLRSFAEDLYETLGNAAIATAHD
jgi:sarcosine oxidase subunit gamma